MPKSDFIFLAHTKSRSTAKVLAKVLVFQQLFNHKTDCTVRKLEKGCLKPTTQVITMLEALASRPAIKSIKTHYQVIELHALNARTKLLPTREVGFFFHPSEVACTAKYTKFQN